ncbi:MAG: glycosyltransferase [Gemmatales bacterium]
MQPNESAPSPLVSIIILCCNQVEVTRLCLSSLARHTPQPHQLLLVDNGSTDETPAVLEQFAREGHPGLMALSIIRNEQNRGFAAGVNQGLQRATGENVVLINNDTVLPPVWLEGLLGVARHVPHAGLVGAVSNEVPEPQRVLPGYGTDLQGLDAFAQQRRQTHARQVMEVERISGFCLLIPRSVLQTVGALDERFGLGFFEDDDLGIRVRNAGYKLLVAIDTYIHHWGSQTIKGLGIDAGKMLTENLSKFRDKWGDEQASRYSIAESQQTVSQEPATVSLCMILKNEEGNLAACLDGIHDLVQEMVIVDTGSTDATKAIAEKYGAKVVDFPWVDSFAAARNVSLEHASGDYIFWLDADDRVDEANRAKLKALFSTLHIGEMMGVDMKCVCLPDPISGVTTVVDHIRLFPRHPAIRWKYRIHEQILPAIRQKGGTVRFADIHIQHVGYQDPALRRRKLDRDIRLLNLENDEHPDDPFTLFNLGSVYLELDQAQTAIPLLERSLARSHPTDSIVRKLYALLVQAHKRLNQQLAALAICQQGQKHYPQDAELLFQEGLLKRDTGDLSGAAKTLEQLLLTKEKHHFASVDVGLSSFKARHNLAVVYREMGRIPNAIQVWQQVLHEAPDFHPARLGLAEAYLHTGPEHAFQEQLQGIRQITGLELQATILDARSRLIWKDFEGAKALLNDAIAKHPDSLQPTIILSHAYLQEGKDWTTAQRLLEDILQRDPGNLEAKRNLEVLKRQRC